MFMCSFHANSYAFWLFVIPYIFVHTFTSFWYIVFNKFQTPVQGHTSIPGGECHGYRNQVTIFGPCVAIGENGLGMLTYAQVCCHDSTLHAQSFSHPKGKVNDHDIITWCHCHLAAYIDWRRVFKEVCTRLGVLICLSLLASWSLGLFPGWSIWETTDPLTWLPQCLLSNGTITRKEKCSWFV